MLNSSIKRIAVTGGLAAGKSTVCRFFAECGAYVVSADKIVHELLEVPSKVTAQVVELLGEKAVFTSSGRISGRRGVPGDATGDEGIAKAFAEEPVASDGRLVADRKLSEDVNTADKVLVKAKLDRGRIAQCVFCDPKLASALEELLHPHVHHALEDAYQACTQANYPLFVAEVPLLYEVGWEKDFDFVVVVLADPDQCRKRFRNSFPSESLIESDRAYFQRMERQMDPKEKATRADCVLVNETTDQDLQKAVQKLYRDLTAP